MKRRYTFVFYYAIISTSVFLLFILSSFISKDKTLTADEITVKRITVVGEDGTSPRVVISNETRQHSGQQEGIKWDHRDRPAGMIFFNNQGDECGGLIFGVNKEKNNINHAVSLTMDNHLNDQVIQLINNENYDNGKSNIFRGLVINEYPENAVTVSTLISKVKALDSIKDAAEKAAKQQALFEKEGAKPRLFIGRKTNEDNGLFLYDSKGNPKMKLYVDKAGNPKIEVITADGQTKNILQ
ncbi:hypothetical protein [Chitinophaga sp. Cy-1792]|uniref:hypothetical protein n=1 Tax=Chitinophaga sp. Cy-1792 TaxID=2608339 RepID=UPI00142161D4|nr:hypothetical protein [Chitinophaga sp. Cy-1792]NIG53974.1 hypothetical protein [Chitinophaga sp. Cy-1792]